MPVHADDAAGVTVLGTAAGEAVGIAGTPAASAVDDTGKAAGTAEVFIDLSIPELPMGPFLDDILGPAYRGVKTVIPQKPFLFLPLKKVFIDLSIPELPMGPFLDDILGPAYRGVKTVIPQKPFLFLPLKKVRGDQGEREESSQLTEEDALSIAASWGETAFPIEMEVGGEPELSAEAEPSSEVASEASVPPLSSSTSALMGRAATFLQVPWMAAAEPCQSVFWTQATTSCRQPFPTFPDIMEEVPSSWDHPAFVPSVLKQALQLTSLEGMEKLGISPSRLHLHLGQGSAGGGLPKNPVCPNPQCRVTGTHLRRAYAVEARVTRLANTAGILTAYLDGILREASLPEPVALELRLLSAMLLQISGLQGQALGRSLASLIVAHRQLWLSQASKGPRCG
ncbi:UNVERIFIED_CONTAM: hypothetical protein FKN15_010303 [Acipenser sinensis]